MFNRTYTLKKSRNILKSCAAWFEKKGKDLPKEEYEKIANTLEKLDWAVYNKNRVEADRFARETESYTHTHYKKSFFEYAVELFFALAFALVIATIVRQSWFELYEIPSGSMRPTFKEQDRLTVTKTAFGINVPLATDHFYFDPDLVQRTSVVIWSGANIPGADEDTKYFDIFPYKKRYIKRLMGKPGDTLYFYGGKIYGIDKEGNKIDEFLTAPWLEKLEYLPYMYFEGLVKNPKQNQLDLTIMGQAIGRLTFSRRGEGTGEIFNGTEWVQDDPKALLKPHDHIVSYSDNWGIRNFAMARLLTKEEVKELTPFNPDELDEGVLYLELRHTPRLASPNAQVIAGSVIIPSSSTIIPLKQKHLDTLMDNMYTTRFSVQKGKATRYNFLDPKFSTKGQLFPKIADGTYEFYYGKADEIGWGGIPHALEKDSPLYSHDPKHVKALFNTGIEIHPFYDPISSKQTFFPHRYAYFREGDLYVMGAPLLKKDDPTLIKFIDKEKEAEFPFVDQGTPSLETIKNFGLKIPEKHYLVLGDNHAVSLDSRFFGPVPQANLQGAPSLILWPPGDNRLGFPAQKPYPILNTPRLIVWSLAALLFLLWALYNHHRHKKHIFIRS